MCCLRLVCKNKKYRPRATRKGRNKQHTKHGIIVNKAPKYGNQAHKAKHITNDIQSNHPARAIPERPSAHGMPRTGQASKWALEALQIEDRRKRTKRGRGGVEERGAGEGEGDEREEERNKENKEENAEEPEEVRKKQVEDQLDALLGPMPGPLAT